jgi:hypothetical protein
MTVVETVDPRVVRDIQSNALLAINEAELTKSRAVRSTAKKNKEHQQEVTSKLINFEDRLRKLELLIEGILPNLTNRD